MFELHLDATYAWLGLALVSVVTVGVVAALPTSPPPDAASVAHTIDSVADGEYVATAEHGLAADQIRLTHRTIALESGDTTARATLHGAPVTPVRPRTAGGDARLQRVLDGVPPDAVFDDPAELIVAIERAQTTAHQWRLAPDRLTVRQVHYGDLRVTLVG
ncbi:MAG: hypothetical protein PPP55_07250 [Halorubrum sp.]